MDAIQNEQIDNENVEKVIDEIIEEALGKCRAYQEGLNIRATKNTPSQDRNENISIFSSKTIKSIVNTTEDGKRGSNDGNLLTITPVKNFISESDNDNKLDEFSYYPRQFFSKQTDDVFNLKDPNDSLNSPVTCNWCCGINSNAPVINLQEDRIIFAAAHMVVVYDIKVHKMILNKGHLGVVTSLSRCRDLVASCDAGNEESTIIVRDSNTFAIQHCWQGREPTGGFKLLLLTESKLFAVTFGLNPLLFIWTFSEPPQVMKLPHGTPIHLYGDHRNKEAILTFQQKVLIVQCDNSQFQETSPARSSQRMGCYCTSIAVACYIMTGTRCGKMVVRNRKGACVKIVKLHSVGINCMDTNEETIILGFDDGLISLYESDLRLRNTFSKLPSAIRCIALNVVGDSIPESYSYMLASGTIGSVSRSKNYPHIQFANEMIMSIDKHPHLPYVALGYADASIVIFNAITKLGVNKAFFKRTPLSIKYSSMGSILAVGTEGGDVYVVDATSLKLVKELVNMAGTAINNLIFHSYKNVLAYTYGTCGVGMIKLTQDWNLSGKYRPHTLPITGIVFVEDKLYTIAEDRMLVQFNASSMLQFVTRHAIEQAAKPTAIVHFDGQLLIANSEGKVRFFDTTQKMVVRTIRGPSANAIHCMKVEKNQLAFAAGSDIGVCPLPWRDWGTLISAHPHKVKRICLAGDKLLTSAQNILLVWSINENHHVTTQAALQPLQQHLVKRIFNSGPIPQVQLINNLHLLGYFPSQFEIANILREYQDMDISEAVFREIIFNYCQTPRITAKQAWDAVISVSDATRGVVHVSKLIQILTSQQSADTISEEEIMDCLRKLYAPRHVPPTVTINQFLSQILGIVKLE